jgi:hypothetical protein
MIIKGLFNFTCSHWGTNVAPCLSATCSSFRHLNPFDWIKILFHSKSSIFFSLLGNPWIELVINYSCRLIFNMFNKGSLKCQIGRLFVRYHKKKNIREAQSCLYVCLTLRAPVPWNVSLFKDIFSDRVFSWRNAEPFFSIDKKRYT